MRSNLDGLTSTDQRQQVGVGSPTETSDWSEGVAKEPVLESAVMDVLWDADTSLTTAEVRSRLSHERSVAYTTVMTVMVRLWKKGLLDREGRGKAYAYRPVRPRDQHAADRMEAILGTAGDRSAALSRFVDTLTEAERRELKHLLEGP